MYGQNNEDSFLWEYFEQHPPKRGYKNFLDIGANDGKTLSNTLLFAQNGWGGVCVEPDERAFERLQETHKDHAKVQCVKAGIGAKTETAPFYQSGELLKQNDIALVSTTRENEKARFDRSVEFVPSKVKLYNWADFLEIAQITPKFALISIDAEGCDLDILKQIDLANVQAVCVEWNGRRQLKDAYTQLCQGMRLAVQNAENLIFVR